MTGAALFFGLVDALLLMQLATVCSVLFFGRIHSVRGKQGENPDHPRCRDHDLDRRQQP